MHMKKSRIISPYIIFAQFFWQRRQKSERAICQNNEEKSEKIRKKQRKKRNVPQIEGFSGKKRQKVNERIFANFARFDPVTCKNEKGG